MVSMCKSKILFFIAFFALTTLASANTCTDAWYNYYKARSNPQEEFHLDSTYYSFEGNIHFSQKFIYDNGRIIQRNNIYDDTTETVFYHYNSNESVLKKIGTEYIISECEAMDTLCYVLRTYENGLYTETDTTKQTSNYMVEYGSSYHFEFILKKDTIIEKYLFIKDNDTVETHIGLAFADPNDDFKCIESNETGSSQSTLLYEPNENGFSIKMLNDSIQDEHFFVKNENTKSIRKTHKPVKIAPKARYFDLLGRYKFTK